LETTEQIRDRLQARFPGAEIAAVVNPGPAAQHSLLLGAAHAREVAEFLRGDPDLQLDYCSNVSGVDWPPREMAETHKPAAPETASGPKQAAAPGAKPVRSGYLEVVYHLYSMALSHGPVIVRLRTTNRTDQVTLPSLTPVWRSCEFQEREVFDLFGVVFSGHPDLRRILMWDGFEDHPMRKDYVEPDDYEWEPTAHGEVLAKAKRHLLATRAAAVGPEERRP
jgi:NADH-quinone oxidoreductase subunit C